MARIESLYIVTTKKETKITNYEQDNLNIKKESDIYSIIEIIPDKDFRNIAMIKGLYNYGRKINDRQKCKFLNPDFLSVIDESGDDLLSKLVNLFQSMILDEELNGLFLKGLKYPGSNEQQKFINAFVSGVAIILCMAEFIKGVENIEETGEIYKNPVYPLNLCFPSLNISPNILNSNFYNYLAYYIYTAKEKYGIVIQGIGLLWLEQINNFWNIFRRYFSDNDDVESLVAIHASTVGFAKYFEERVYQAKNKLDEDRMNSIELINRSLNNSLSELNETYEGYVNQLKMLALDSEKSNHSYTQQLSEKFFEFNEIVDDAADEYQKKMNEVKSELTDFLDKNKKELMNDIMTHWDKQLTEINKIKNETIKSIDIYERDTTQRINESSQSLINSAITKIRNEVDTLIEQIINKKDGLLSDMNVFNEANKTEISTYISTFRIDIANMQGKIEKEWNNLKNEHHKLKKNLNEKTDEVLTLIEKANKEFENRFNDLKLDLKRDGLTLVNDEIKFILSNASDKIVSDLFDASIDSLSGLLIEKIQKIIDTTFNPALKEIVNELGKMKNNYIDEINEHRHSLINIKDNTNDIMGDLEILKNYLDAHNLEKFMETDVATLKKLYDIQESRYLERLDEMNKKYELEKETLITKLTNELNHERKENKKEREQLIRTYEESHKKTLNMLELLEKKYNQLERRYQLMDLKFNEVKKIRDPESLANEIFNEMVDDKKLTA